MQIFWILFVLALSCTKRSENKRSPDVAAPTRPPIDVFDPPPVVTTGESLPAGLNGSWTASVGVENRCNLVYEIIGAESKLKTVLSCLDSASHTIRREERLYQYAIDQNALLNLTLQESTCPRESTKTDISLEYKLGTLNSGDAALILKGPASSSRTVTLVKSADKVDPQFLAASDSYRSFTFQKGCFAQGQINRFTASQP